MADRYERWNKWAPRYVYQFREDFDLADFQAAAFPGNFAAESGYFNLLQELKPHVKGSRGGWGHAQHTGPRRRRLEAWLKRKGLSADSFEGNYSYMYRELKGHEKDLDYRHVIQKLKTTKTLEEAVYIVGKYYEGPLKLNLAPREKAAKEALDLYWKASKEVLVPTQPIVAPVTPLPSQPGIVSPPAIPWYKSWVATGSTAGLGASVVAIMQAYQPGVPFLNQLDTLVPPVVAAFGTFAALISRVGSQSQPLTGTQKAADQIAAKAGLPNEEEADTLMEQHALYGPATAQPMMRQQVALEEMPLVTLAHELPRLAQLLGVVVPALGVLGTIAQAVQSANPPVRREQ